MTLAGDRLEIAAAMVNTVGSPASHVAHVSIFIRYKINLEKAILSVFQLTMKKTRFILEKYTLNDKLNSISILSQIII